MRNVKPVHKPSWFSKGKVLISTARTCGLTTGGRLLPLVDPKTGAAVQTIDPETGEPVDAINDQLRADMQALATGGSTDTLQFVERSTVSMRAAVPVYYDRRAENTFKHSMKASAFDGFSSMTIGEMIAKRLITVRGGHGSPSAAKRIGDVPYIKVSDLRAGLVNINPTNQVPLKVAERYWRAPDSGLKTFDLLSPERASKNIGEFCVLLPGQERLVLTKEIIVMRPGSEATFDSFYLLWALSLKIVRDQWKRIVFMQTSREDVGKRYHELLLPHPDTAERGRSISEPFRSYYLTLANARSQFSQYLTENRMHHFFVAGAEPSKAVGIAGNVA